MLTATFLQSFTGEGKVVFKDVNVKQRVIRRRQINARSLASNGFRTIDGIKLPSQTYNINVSMGSDNQQQLMEQQSLTFDSNDASYIEQRPIFSSGKLYTGQVTFPKPQESTLHTSFPRTHRRSNSNSLVTPPVFASSKRQESSHNFILVNNFNTSHHKAMH